MEINFFTVIAGLFFLYLLGVVFELVFGIKTILWSIAIIALGASIISIYFSY